MADDPRAGVLRVLARRAPRRSTSTPTSPTRSSATSARPATRSSRPAPGWSCSSHTARLWRSLGHHDHEGALPHRRRDRAGRVLGGGRRQRLHEPDGRAEPAHRGRASPRATRRARAQLGVDEEEIAAWRDAADRDARPVRRAAAACTRRPRASPSHELMRLRRAASTRCCCTSRTSSSTARRWSSRPTSCSRCYLRGDRFTAEEKARDFAYYEPITVRDSSLSACAQAVVAAEVGHLELAYDYFGEAALMDLGDLDAQHPRRAAHRVAGGLVDRRGGRLRRDARPRRDAVVPAAPAERARPADVPACATAARSLKVDVRPHEVTYELLDGEPLEIVHDDETLTVDGAGHARVDAPRPGPGAQAAARPRAPAPARAWITSMRNERRGDVPCEGRSGRDAQGRRDHGRRQRRAGEDRRGRRCRRRHGARARPGRHPPRRRRRAHVRSDR